MLRFFRIFAAMFIAEMGDKTQLLMIAMTSRYKLGDIIIGSGASILALNTLAVLLGSFVSSLIPEYLVKIIAAAAFLYFAFSSLFKKEEGNDADPGKNTLKTPILVIFWTFFVAEFGDKTQLSAITFAADEGSSHALTVCLACSLGLFAADLLGMFVGDIIKRFTGPHFMDRLAFLLFFIFGMITANDALRLLGFNDTFSLILANAAIIIAFSLILILEYRHKRSD